MKKDFLIFLAIVLGIVFFYEAFICNISHAADTVFEVADQAVTVSCDPVTTMIRDGEEVAIPSEDSVSYRWYYAIAGNENLTPIQTGDDTSEPLKTIVFASEGAFYMGVAAVRKVTVENESFEFLSEISFSNNPAVVENGQIWGVVSYSPPSSPFNLRRMDISGQ